jgi:hypothetical protein
VTPCINSTRFIAWQSVNAVYPFKFKAHFKTKAKVLSPEEVEDLVGHVIGGVCPFAVNSNVDIYLADQLPEGCKKSCFIFSTSAIIGEDKVAKDHLALRLKLVSKGYIVKGEFSCKGFNANSFLKFFGGMNKGRPNSEDLKNAAEFALNLE